MEKILCVYCGDLFDPSPRHKMKIDPVYNASQKISQKEWARANPGYWKRYRNKNPEKAERNRVLQAVRNRKARSKKSDIKIHTPLIAKMDASKSDNFQALGQFWLVPVIAKMDSLKVNIVKIPICYP